MDPWGYRHTRSSCELCSPDRDIPTFTDQLSRLRLGKQQPQPLYRAYIALAQAPFLRKGFGVLEFRVPLS